MEWRLRIEAQAVAFTVENGGAYFLLVKKHNGWRIPKGGVEKGETFEETIKRELWEEVGFKPEDIVVLQKFNEYMYEDHRAQILRNPHVYLVYIRGKPKPRPDYEEISDATWVPYRRALQMLRFREEKNTIRMAKELIEKLSQELLTRLEAK